MRGILSLRHPWPDRAILSFGGTNRFWEEYDLFIPIPIFQRYHTTSCDYTEKENSEQNLRVGVFGEVKNLYVGGGEYPLIWLLIQKARSVAFNLYIYPRSSASKVASVQLPNVICNCQH